MMMATNGRLALAPALAATGSVADGDEIAVTDNGNYIVDLFFKEPIKDAVKAAEELKGTVGAQTASDAARCSIRTAISAPAELTTNAVRVQVGVVDHGLFCGLTTAVIIAGSDGISVQEP